MGRQINGLLYFYFANFRHSIIIFWTILMGILMVSLTFSYFMKDIEDGFMTMSLTVPMYIYCAILGFLTVKEAIPFSLKRGAIRKNIFVSLAVFFFVLSFAQAVVGSTIQVIVDFFNTKVGIDMFSFQHLAYFTTDTWLHRIFIDTSVMFFFFSVMFVIGLLFYRYGLAGGGAVIGLFVIIVLTGVGQGWLIDFLVEQFRTLDHMFYFQLFIIGVIFYVFSILLLRNITIVKKA